MIEIKNVSKSFGNIKALNEIYLDIEESKIFGLVGTNGAGKSTLMNILCGAYLQDQGDVLIDGEKVYENEDIKAQISYIQDDPFYPRNATPKSMAKLYQSIYGKFDMKRFVDLMSKLELAMDRKVSTFSKGMKKQLSIMLALCCNPKYLILDETFDGLDPAIRQVVKSMFIQAMENSNVTPIIASHNLREIEDICDSIGLIHKGGVLLSKDISNLKLELCKIQCAFSKDDDVEAKLKTLADANVKIMQRDARGSVNILVLGSDEEYALEQIRKLEPLICEALPLNLEEIFIAETEVEGYDIKKIIL